MIKYKLELFNVFDLNGRGNMVIAAGSSTDALTAAKIFLRPELFEMYELMVLPIIESYHESYSDEPKILVNSIK